MNIASATIRIIDIQQEDPAQSFAAMSDAIAGFIQAKGRCTPLDLIKDRFRPMQVIGKWGQAYCVGALLAKARSNRAQHG